MVIRPISIRSQGPIPNGLPPHLAQNNALGQALAGHPTTESNLPPAPALRHGKMICSVIVIFFLLASAAMAQQLMPGTLASSNRSDSSSSDAPQPITGQERIRWAIRNAIGPGALFSAGFGTLL